MSPPNGVAGRTSGSPRGASRPLSAFMSSGQHAPLTWLLSGVETRGVLFSWLVVIGFLNGIAHRAMLAVTNNPGESLDDTFGISAVVWIALVFCVVLFRRGPSAPASSRDVKVFLAALVVFAAPVAPLSWLALSAFGFYAMATSPSGSSDARAGAIVLGLTVPMFWSKLVFTVLSDVILRADAAIVAFIIGTERDGNAVAFRDGWGYFWIAPGCSSISNVSLAILCWLLVTRGFYPDRRVPGRYCLYAAAAVVAVNVFRISVTGIGRHEYDIVHSALGNTLSGVFALAAMFAICIYGARRAACGALR